MVYYAKSSVNPASRLYNSSERKLNELKELRVFEDVDVLLVEFRVSAEVFSLSALLFDK